MTHVIALDGQWEGLRAIPRTLRTPDHRKRLEDGLERIAGLYDAMATRAAMLTAGMARLDGLAAGMISQLDAIDGDADFEPYIPSPGGDDREFDTCDLGEPDVDSEPSLCGVTVSVTAAMTDQTDREADLSWGGEYATTDQTNLTSSLEGDSTEDLEPSLSTLQRGPDDQCGSRWLGSLATDDREESADDEPSLCGVSFGHGHPSDAEATGSYGIDQTREPHTDRFWKAAPRLAQPRKPLLTVVGPVLPIFGPDGWQMSIYRDGQWVSA